VFSPIHLCKLCAHIYVNTLVTIQTSLSKQPCVYMHPFCVHGSTFSQESVCMWLWNSFYLLVRPIGEITRKTRGPAETFRACCSLELMSRAVASATGSTFPRDEGHTRTHKYAWSCRSAWSHTQICAPTCIHRDPHAQRSTQASTHASTQVNCGHHQAAAGCIPFPYVTPFHSISFHQQQPDTLCTSWTHQGRVSLLWPEHAVMRVTQVQTDTHVLLYTCME